MACKSLDEHYVPSLTQAEISKKSWTVVDILSAGNEIMTVQLLVRIVPFQVLDVMIAVKEPNKVLIVSILVIFSLTAILLDSVKSNDLLAPRAIFIINLDGVTSKIDIANIWLNIKNKSINRINFIDLNTT